MGRPGACRSTTVLGLVAVAGAVSLSACSSESTEARRDAGATTATRTVEPATPAPTAAPTSDGPPSTPAPTGRGSPAERLVEVRLRGGTVTPPPGRVSVQRGERIRIVVDTDEADEVHVHGYDRMAAMAPGRPAVLAFRADETGLFEVETHDSGRLLLQLLVR